MKERPSHLTRPQPVERLKIDVLAFAKGLAALREVRYVVDTPAERTQRLKGIIKALKAAWKTLQPLKSEHRQRLVNEPFDWALVNDRKRSMNHVLERGAVI